MLKVDIWTFGSLANGTHDLIVSYKCQYCSFESAKKAELMVHMDRMHFSTYVLYVKKIVWGEKKLGSILLNIMGTKRTEMRIT